MDLIIVDHVDSPIEVDSYYYRIPAPISYTNNNNTFLWDNNSIETTITYLDRIFAFKGYIDVYNFLRENQFLISLLFEAYFEIMDIFGKDVNLSLKVSKDDEYEKLYLLINSSHQDAYDLLDKLDENWWIDVIPRAKNKMNIDLEY